MSKRLLSFACWLMVLVLPMDSLALDSVGMLTISGTVLVDNRPAGGSGAVFDGDVVQTKAASKAVIAGRGRIVLLGENSSVTLAKVLKLQSGSVVVSANNGGVTQVENATITTTPGVSTRFLAKKIDGEVQVLALEGTVYVSDGQQTTPVPPTKGVGIPTRNAGKAARWLHNDDLGILIVVGAAIAAGVTVGVLNSRSPSSPSAP